MLLPHPLLLHLALPKYLLAVIPAITAKAIPGCVPRIYIPTEWARHPILLALCQLCCGNSWRGGSQDADGNDRVTVGDGLSIAIVGRVEDIVGFDIVARAEA